jgi:hypothetical protein
MATYFVSSGDGSDSDAGNTLDLAWATLEHAWTAGSLSAGDVIMVRRTHSETPTNDVAFIYDGARGNPIITACCPRDAFSITSATWTNGSTAVDLILPASMDREAHQARYITGPDGETYFITRVVDTNTITIDREYEGSTVTLGSGASTIQADLAQSAWDNYDDSADTIKKTDWEADADTLPQIDFNSTAFLIDIDGDDFYSFYGLEILNSADAAGGMTLESRDLFFRNCLFSTTSNVKVINVRDNSILLQACTIEGSGSGSSQIGIACQAGNINVKLKDVAIYNCGDAGISSLGTTWFLECVNIGVEVANGDDDILVNQGSIFHGRDVKLGGSNGYITFVAPSSKDRLSFENYQKVLGDHRVFYPGGYFEKAAVSGETPNKKVSDDVVKITPSTNDVPSTEFAFMMIQHEIEVTADTHTFKYWIYNDSGSTLNDTTATDDIYLVAEYVKQYDDTSEYIIAEATSTQIDILDAADANDWDYLEVSVTTATASKVRLTIYLKFYDAADNIFIDPAVVIS